ncbi:uncharacterized protein LOC121803887 [Salvia splendens]|uniref:uncharacterized protein LOC121803887 n=1 Tax=Salvia splendens TaxID=180675 RepID=UPI001C265A47|nr:uncharacterized protein LOC121803887 [Salvia splendens]
MLIEQIPTSSSSSSARADSDSQEASSQAQIENPSPPTPTTAPLQTSDAAPLPEVDKEAQRSLTRILWSMPSDTDISTVYATLKARLVITLSKDKAAPSTSQNPPRNPPSISQTQAPLHTTEPTPVIPLVQYSGDDSEEEGAQPAATPSTTAESVPPPHAEGTTALNACTPPSVGGSNSPTLRGPAQPIEVVNIDDDSGEDFLPPSEILQQGEADWNFFPHAEDESVPDREEEQLRRRSHGMEINRMVEEVKARMASMQRAEEERVERLRVARRLLNESDEPETQGVVGAINQGAGEAVEERGVVEDSRQEAEKKRKGKETVLPSLKRMRLATRGIMLIFDNPKWNEEIHQRETPTKRLKAGKKLHQPALATIRVEEKFTQYITGIGFDWLLEIEETFVPKNLAKEFFTSFRFTGSTNLEAMSVSFRVFGRQQEMSPNVFSVRMRLYTEARSLVENG